MEEFGSLRDVRPSSLSKLAVSSQSIFVHLNTFPPLVNEHSRVTGMALTVCKQSCFSTQLFHFKDLA